jgi:hypothetical protein
VLSIATAAYLALRISRNPSPVIPESERGLTPPTMPDIELGKR